MTKPYQLLPELTAEEYDALKTDIQAHGIQVPIEVDEEGNVLDGHHRIRIAQEFGFPDEAIPKVVRAGLTEEQKLEHVLRLNLLRRHLTREQKQALALELRQRGWTQERIAATLGVDQASVSRWLQDVMQTHNANPEIGSSLLPPTITDSLGRIQPATKPRRTSHPGRDSDDSGDVAEPPDFVAQATHALETVAADESDASEADEPDSEVAVEPTTPEDGADETEETSADDSAPDAVEPDLHSSPVTEEPMPEEASASEPVASARDANPTPNIETAAEPEGTERRDPNGPPYPFLARPGWKPYHIMEALEHLNRLPADERNEVARLLDQPAIPPTSAIEILKNLVGMTPDERQAIYRWNRSDDPRERSLALTQAARRPPMPDPRLNYLEDARKLIGKAAALSSGQLRQELEDMRDWLTEAIRLVEEEDRRAAAAVGWPRPVA